MSRAGPKEARALAQPTPYSRQHDLLDYATSHTSAPFNAQYVDDEFDAIETTLDAICTNLALIQRDDGYLKNGSVHVDAFSTASLALIASEWTPRGLWATATSYAVGDIAQQSTASYVCVTAHTSGTFATDYAAGKWIILGATSATVASAISSSAYGHLAATNVQAAIEELVDEKARLAGLDTQTFAVADATDDSHAVNAGQIQKSSLIHAVAGGSSDALTATLTSGLTTLTDGMHVRIEATAANGTTGPTFNLTLGSTATGAKTIKKGAAAALIAGDIYGAGHKLELVYDLTNDCWLLQNPAYPVGQSTSAQDVDGTNNLGLAFSVGSSAMTVSLKSGSGGTPTSSDPVQIAMRSATDSAGTYSTRSITAATTLTIPASATLGHLDAVQGIVHYYLIDYNSGTMELACSSKFFGHNGIASTTAISSGSTSATVMYSTSARTSVPFRWIGASLDTQTTAGTWANLPTVVRTGFPQYVGMPVVVSKSVAGSSDVTLTQDEARCDILILTGALTGNISVLVDKVPWVWTVFNNTSGSYTLTLKVKGGTGVVITQGYSKYLYCDGTDVEDGVTDVTVTSVTDSTFTIKDNADTTKLLAFECTNIPTGTTRTLYANESADIASPTLGAQGRLTLTTATAVTTSDVTGATTVYFTPQKGNKVELYNGTSWPVYTFTELSQATTDATKSPAAVTTNSNYDVFVWNDSGTLRATRGPAWSSGTSRGTGAGTTELELFEGRYVNKVAITNGPAARRGLYVGTIRTDASSQVNDSLTKRHVWNNYNRVRRPLRLLEATNSWTYTTLTWRQANNSTANQFDVLIGLQEDPVDVRVDVLMISDSTGISTFVGIGLDSTTAKATGCINTQQYTAAASRGGLVTAVWTGFPGLGSHYLSWIEQSVASGTSTWYGDNNAPTNEQSGMSGGVWA